MLFYRTETLRTSDSLKQNYDLQVEIKSADNGSAELSEAYLNEKILEQDCTLRSVLNFEDTYTNSQFYVLQKINNKTEDHMFTVNQLPQSFINEYESLENSEQKRTLLIQKLSRQLNLIEIKNKCNLIEIICTSFHDI